jgi:hypothetical protein
VSDSIIVSDRYRTPVTAEKREAGGVVLRAARSWIALNEAELDRVVAFARNEARLQCFPAAPKSRPESPQANELTLPGCRFFQKS